MWGMDIIMKLPFLLAIVAALITGFFSMMDNKELNQTCFRMIVALIIFYILGTFAKSTITAIVDEQEKARQEEERRKNEELEREKLQNIQDEKSNQEGHLGKKLDLVADDLIDDGFSPLDLSQAVRTKMKE